MYRWENQLDQGAQLGHFGVTLQCLNTAREFRRGFSRNGDRSHKLQDASGFIHTDIACLCRKGQVYSASVDKGDSIAWLPRPPNKSPATQDETLAELEPAPADGEDASIGDTLFGGVSGGKGVDLTLRQAKGGGRGMLRPRCLQD